MTTQTAYKGFYLSMTMSALSKGVSPDCNAVMPCRDKRTGIIFFGCRRSVVLFCAWMMIVWASPAQANTLTKMQHAAEQGNATAQAFMGVMYYLGRGVLQDYAKAEELFRLSAKQGNASAQANLGVMYLRGVGVKQDFKEAMKWLRQAADKGNATAQATLGVISQQGKVVKQDFKEAAKWFGLASDQGHAVAQARLGILYYLGKGMPRDLVLAHMWLNLAASRGVQKAIGLRDAVTKHMTQEQVAKAQELARNWKISPTNQDSQKKLLPSLTGPDEEVKRFLLFKELVATNELPPPRSVFVDNVSSDSGSLFKLT